jgi:hypothetical protein
VSLVVDALVIAGGLALGRWIARSIRARRARAQAPASPNAPSEEGVLAGAALREAFAPFPCKLGDVVARAVERDEAWLAGALVFLEERPVAALFVAPEAGGDRAIFVRDAPGAGVTWLSPLAAADLPLTKEPPYALEHDGARFERTRRLPVRVARAGDGAPNLGDRAVVSEYGGPGTRRIVVVAGSERTLAWSGVALAPTEYDVLPGAGAEPNDGS